jgi:hypothetical protein
MSLNEALPDLARATLVVRTVYLCAIQPAISSILSDL